MTEEKPIFWGKYFGNRDPKKVFVEIPGRRYDSSQIERITNGPAILIDEWDHSVKRFVKRPNDEINAIARERGADIVAIAAGSFHGKTRLEGTYVLFKVVWRNSLPSPGETIPQKPQEVLIWGNYCFDRQQTERFGVKIENTEQSLPRSQLEFLGSIAGYKIEKGKPKRLTHDEVEKQAKVKYEGRILIVPSSAQKPIKNTRFNFYRLPSA